MRIQSFFLPVLAASVLAACGSRGGSREDSAPPPPPEPPKPVVSCVAKPKPATPAPASAKGKTPAKPAAKPAPRSKKAAAAASSSSSASSEAAPATMPADADGKCPAGYDAVVSAPAAQAASASSSSAATGKDGERPSRQVKSDDGSVEGTVYGSPAAGSKLAKVKIGMTEGEVRKAIGEPDDISSYVTGKAFIPFYFGNDSARVEWIYSGFGSIAFNAGGFGGRRLVMMINHDPKMR